MYGGCQFREWLCHQNLKPQTWKLGPRIFADKYCHTCRSKGSCRDCRAVPGITSAPPSPVQTGIIRSRDLQGRIPHDVTMVESTVTSGSSLPGPTIPPHLAPSDHRISSSPTAQYERIRIPPARLSPCLLVSPDT